MSPKIFKDSTAASRQTMIKNLAKWTHKTQDFTATDTMMNGVDLVSSSEDDDDVMPPKGGTLTKDQVAKIKAWITEGAKFPEGLTLKDKSPKKK